MRVSEGDILKAIATKLSDNGFYVVADDVREGFRKPAVFVGCYPSEIMRLPGNRERVTDTVEITYHPAEQTRIQCMNAANRLRDIFLYSNLTVKERVFSLEDISFDVDSKTCILTCDFEIVYEQFMPDDEEYEDMEEMVITGGI